MSRRGGRRSMRHRIRCFTASKPIAPRAMASRTALATRREEHLHQPENLHELALTQFPIRASIRRRSVMNSSGNRQPTSGAA